MLERIILNITALSWYSKFFAIVMAVLAPLYSLIVFIAALLVLDMITSIYYQMRIEAAKYDVRSEKFRHSVRVIESGKLRKTVEKMFSYFTMIIMFYAFDIFVLKIEPLDGNTAIHTFSITNLAAILICLVEMTSIAANFTKITGNPVFARIVKIFSKKVNKQYDIDDDENKQ